MAVKHERRCYRNSTILYIHRHITNATTKLTRDRWERCSERCHKKYIYKKKTIKKNDISNCKLHLKMSITNACSEVSLNGSLVSLLPSLRASFQWTGQKCLHATEFWCFDLGPAGAALLKLRKRLVFKCLKELSLLKTAFVQKGQPFSNG